MNSNQQTVCLRKSMWIEIERFPIILLQRTTCVAHNSSMKQYSMEINHVFNMKLSSNILVS